jgi:RNA polymerase primary sigma factor
MTSPPLRASGRPSPGEGRDSVSAYLATIWGLQALSRERELELARRIRQARLDLATAIFASPIAAEALRAASWSMDGGDLAADEAGTSGFAVVPSSDAKAAVLHLADRVEELATRGGEAADGRSLYPDLVSTGLEHELTGFVARWHQRVLGELQEEAWTPHRRVDRSQLALMGALQTSIVRARREASRARDALARAHLRLVVSDARRFMGRGVALADLIQEGNLGLLAALDRFDPDLGYRFNTYALWWIRAKLRASVAQDGRTIRIPVRRLQALSRVHQTARLLSTELGREPTAAELAERVELSVDAVEALLEVPREPLRFEALDAREDGTSVADRLEDPSAVDPIQIVSEGDDRALARVLFDSLDEREARIIRERFGFRTDERTLEDIGRELGVTRERVRQLEARALRKMRDVAVGLSPGERPSRPDAA